MHQRYAEGQCRTLIKSSKNDGVASAEPRVVTGHDDSTVNKTPPRKEPLKDWDVNYDPADMNEGDFPG
jgi:hypothetical protein